MDFRYHYDPDTGLPHIYGHGVTEEEVEQVMRGSSDDFAGGEDSRMKVGKTAAGRYLQVPRCGPQGCVHHYCVRADPQVQEGVSAA